jgi:AcrR family transcriptional regulator
MRVAARRTPVQERSKATVARILDAAAHVFAESGYGGTTNHVAAQAQVSIGSLYQYFPDKDALLAALHDRHLAAIESHLLGNGPVDEPGVWLDWLVDELIERNVRPESQALWEASRFSPRMRGRVHALVEAVASDAASVLSLDMLRARVVIVTALALVHEIVLPTPTASRRHAALRAVRAVASLPAE